MQGYVSINPEIRIRKQDDTYYLTQKSDGTLIRKEHETEITKEKFEFYLSQLQTNLIYKTRYSIPINQYTAELDIYHGYLEGLITVEVEFNDEYSALKFIKPEYFGLDITDDKRYKNKNLVINDDPNILPTIKAKNLK